MLRHEVVGSSAVQEIHILEASFFIYSNMIVEGTILIAAQCLFLIGFGVAHIIDVVYEVNEK